MLIIPNHVYHFKFKSTLSAIDGIYRVVSLTSYVGLVEQDIDLFATTYEPYGLTEEQFAEDLTDIRTKKIVELVMTNDPDQVFYVPELLIDGIPDGSIQKYYQLGLAIDLGVFQEPESIETIRQEIEQVVAVMTGQTGNTVLYTVNESWLTPIQYQAIETARQASISRTQNHYTDKLALQKEIDRLKTILIQYETTLKLYQ